MAQVIDQVALAGMTGLGMLGAWALGRVQGAARMRRGLARMQAGPAIAERPGGNRNSVDRVAITPDPSGTDPLRNRARDEKFGALDRPGALAELHEQASAIRRTERIFDSLMPDLALIDAARRRHSDPVGQPDFTPSGAYRMRRDSDDLSRCDQLSEGALPLTRI